MKIDKYYKSLDKFQKRKLIKRMSFWCNIEKGTTLNYLYGIRQLPAEYVIKVSILTYGHVQPYEIRPDVFPQDYIVDKALFLNIEEN